MKSPAFYLFVFFLLTVTCSNARTKEWIPDYRISSSERDKNLKTTEAVFEIEFFNSELKAIKDGIRMSYNGKEITLKPDSKGKRKLGVNPGTYVFKFLYNTKHFEITTDSINIKPGYRSKVIVTFRRSDIIITVEKPVIYVYAPFKDEICMNLKPKARLNDSLGQGKIDFSYPEYKSGWKFTADKDGNIISGGKQFHYLFWDGKIDFEESKLNMSEGFIVEKSNTIEFFEKKLSAMGLNSKEIEDYITYWGPRMSSYNACFIRFMFNEEYNEYAALDVSPKPDKLFRVFMLWEGLEGNANIKVKEQTLPSFNRSGFTIVEWGGAQINTTDAIKN
ncbi:MAG: hypothetical protein K0S32_3573 [Bacteroidetes bacterium]|jgi:hypothetical protein|nr:hypothetical protein [Bacteroidota bacterium]